MTHNLFFDRNESFHFHYSPIIINMSHIIWLFVISPMEMAILHVKLNWLSVATITTFIIGVEFKNSPGRSVKAMTHSMLNLKFLLEISEQKPTRFIRKHCSSGGYLKCNSWIYRSASTCSFENPDTAWSSKQINKIINNSTTSSNKKSTNQKDSSTTVASKNVDNVDVVIIKITVTNEIIFEEINSKNYSKKI